jgi:hypothetical protein
LSPVHITWDVSFGTIISIVTFLGITIPLFIRLGEVLRMFKEFPPHKHQGQFIIYPRGYEPARARRMGRNGGGDDGDDNNQS